MGQWGGAHWAGNADVAIANDEGAAGSDGEVQRTRVPRCVRCGAAGLLSVDALGEVEGGVEGDDEGRLSGDRCELAASTVHPHPLAARNMHRPFEPHRPAAAFSHWA